MKNKLTFQWIEKDTGKIERLIYCWSIDGRKYKNVTYIKVWYYNDFGETKYEEFKLDSKHWFSILG